MSRPHRHNVPKLKPRRDDPSARAKNRNPETANTAQGKNKQQANATKADRSATQGEDWQHPTDTRQDSENDRAFAPGHEVYPQCACRSHCTTKRRPRPGTPLRSQEAAGPHRSVATKQQVPASPANEAPRHARASTELPMGRRIPRKEERQGPGQRITVTLAFRITSRQG